MLVKVLVVLVSVIIPSVSSNGTCGSLVVPAIVSVSSSSHAWVWPSQQDGVRGGGGWGGEY
jgi:hypothetical protein